MAAPEHLECSRELAEQWPRLLAAAGISVDVASGGLSGTAEWEGRSTNILFEPYETPEAFVARRGGDLDAGDVEWMVALLRGKAGLYQCCLSDVRVRRVRKALMKSFIASGARCSCYGIAVADAVALYAFGGRTGLRDWNDALAGLAELTVEGAGREPGGTGEPELPFGLVTAGPTPMRFVTGPAYAVRERALCPYLELRLETWRGWRDPAMKPFVLDVTDRLKACGGKAVVLWEEVQPDAQIRDDDGDIQEKSPSP